MSEYYAPHMAAKTYEPTAKKHEGRVYIVSGAGSGIGRAAAIILAKEGASVAMWDVNEKALEETQKSIDEFGGKAIWAKVDIADAKATDAGCKEAVDKFGRLDGAANVAALPQKTNTKIADTDDAEFDAIVRVNIVGMKNSMRSQVRHLSSGASVVNVASVAGIWGQWFASAYSASKHAVVGLTRMAAKDYGPDNIRFNAICPAAVDTPMLRAGLHGMTVEDVTKLHPLRRLSQPEEQAHAISFLLSPLSSFITGVALPVDAGFLC